MRNIWKCETLFSFFLLSADSIRFEFIIFVFVLNAKRTTEKYFFNLKFFQLHRYCSLSIFSAMIFFRLNLHIFKINSKKTTQKQTRPMSCNNYKKNAISMKKTLLIFISFFYLLLIRLYSYMIITLARKTSANMPKTKKSIKTTK